MSRYRGRGTKGRPHVGIDLRLMYEGEFLELSVWAQMLYLFIKSRYRPNKVEEIRLPYRFMQQIGGFGSFSTIAKAFKELIEKGWIERVTAGGLLGNNSYYKITFKFDHYADKFNTYDADAEARKNARKLWKL